MMSRSLQPHPVGGVRLGPERGFAGRPSSVHFCLERAGERQVREALTLLTLMTQRVRVPDRGLVSRRARMN